MSIDDLAILADALTFALLVTVGGLIAWAAIRATSRRPNLRRAMKVGLSSGALLAIGLAGVAMWPTARERVDSVTNSVVGGEPPSTIDPSVGEPLVAPEPAPTSSQAGTPSRVAGPTGSDGAVDPSTSGNDGSGGGPSADPGPGTDPSPDPSPTPSPSPPPSPSPSPSPHPSPSPPPSPSPTPSPSPSPSDSA